MKTLPENRLSRNVLIMYAFSVIFLIAAIFTTSWQINGQNERNEIRENGQKTIAVAANRKEVQFITFEGEVITKPILAPQTGTLKQYDSVEIFYDKENPNRVVLVQDENAYNMTMWIVVTKLFGAAIVLAILGNRKQRKLNRVLVSTTS